jgi:hypothetical protein
VCAQQRFEQGFPRWEMTKQRGQSDLGPARYIAHGRVDTVLGDDLSRDRKEMGSIFLGVGSHRFLDKRITDPYIWITGSDTVKLDLDR